MIRSTPIRVLVLVASLLLLAPLGQALAAAPAWKANTSYSAGTHVTYHNAEFQCLEAHKSATGWEPPNVPALWLSPPSPGGITNWKTQTAYVIGSVVRYKGRLWQCRQAHTSQSTFQPSRTPALWRKRKVLPECTGSLYTKVLNNVTSATYTSNLDKSGTEAGIAKLKLSSSVATKVRTLRANAFSAKQKLVNDHSLSQGQRRERIAQLELSTLKQLRALVGSSNLKSFQQADRGARGTTLQQTSKYKLLLWGT